MIGRVLNNRYELVKKVGTGGTAIVYLAKDRLLGRRVAIKILQPQFADNNVAVRRFNNEAQAIASLSHTNIVNIFDIGKEDNLYYIVMEYIKGRDLKEEIDEVGNISLHRSVEIVKEVCQALIKAHRNNIIHCDIKPHNILLTDDGSVKVTDFGIAQAVTAATMHQTDSIMGSAHYLSPEQAKGTKVTARTDIYSLGIVLYELVTGSLPFTGESHISIALKHIEEEAIPPKEINDEVPNELNSIILKAISKRPQERYNSVVEMLRDLKDVRVKVDSTPEVSNQHTLIIPREEYKREINKKGNNDINEKKSRINKEVKGDSSKDSQRKLTEENKAEVTLKNSKGVEEMKGEDIKEGSKGGKDKGKNSLLVALVVLGVAFIGTMVFGYYALISYLEVGEVTVPNLVGQHKDEARQVLKERELGLSVYYETYNQEVEEGHIVSQSPEADRLVKQNRTIEVVLSKGARLSSVPELTGKSLREAEIDLSKFDLRLGEIEEEFSDTVPKGEIIWQSPEAGEEVKAGDMVDIGLSQGREPREVIVPGLAGLRREEALELLRENNLILGQVTERESLTYREGRVIAQSPGEGERSIENSTVQLVISSGIRNPHGSEIKERIVAIDVPPGSQRRVEISIEDDNGHRIVYDRVHRPRERVEQEVILVGPATIRIYFDGQLNYQKRL
ncbi:Stk1 family PASTA domain-containing Ser/Thr kinase [Halonatronum saccharophilum]|uniref:Stk1 family PASTA domain-containing Ser/Thr kinase n=1 Tax=Halonatronum saccharophilum TaxID=150060 RepID=UPI00048993B7|nr:Stk1 family PASTA domain-containing Ser/Thr kinase [Halonatronum saccharophilum]